MGIKQNVSAAVLVLAIAATGCAAPQRQPAPPTPAAPAPGARTPGIQQGTVAYPTPRAGSAYDDPSTGIATVAGAIPGAGTVRAVVLGNVVLLGTDSRDPVIHGRIAQQIRSSFAHIADVRITHDPGQIARLGEALSLIQSHQSVAPLLTDLWSMGNGMASFQ
ncbi:MAG TPA: hypothetical protein VNT75_15635 [Symbiobacteriaceae bacterium]|nr:hypothetical protein [Symbiobacteriaceae bacterium]